MRPRSFSRDMRSQSRNGDRNRDRSRDRSKEDRVNEKRSGSKDERREYKNCIGCKCEDCKKMRQSAKEKIVQLCDGFELNDKILVNYKEKGMQVMILDLGAPMSLAGKEWMEQYLRVNELELNEMKMSECHQVFRFGPCKQC